MASAVESQRLISLSLGKIARSRGQRGGINLHKNLLVASVLNKARTAFMMENYTFQMSQQRSQQVVLTAPQPQPPADVTSSSELRDENRLTQQTTCQATPDHESRSSPLDGQTSTECVSSVSDDCIENNIAEPTANTITPAPVVDDKENVSPSLYQLSENLVSSSIPTVQCITGDQHIDAANQLSQNVQSELEHSQILCNTSNYSSSCKQTSSPCVLKRRRDNPDVVSPSEVDSPACKKIRVNSFSDCSFSHSCELSNSSDSSCSESESDNEEIMQTSESPQISNLVSIFNSGFSGLCMSPPSSSVDYQDNSNSSSMSHQWTSTDSQSLLCSSQVERIGAISSAIVLSA